MGARDNLEKGPASGRWTVLWIALVVQVAGSMAGFSLGVLLPLIKAEFKLTFAQAGLVVNFSFVGGMLTIALAGLAVDLMGDRRVLLLGAAVTGVSAMAAGLAPNLGGLLACLLVMGAGVATLTPAGSVAVRHAFPPHLHASVMSLRQTGVPLGGFVGALLLPPVAIAAGWRGGMLTAGSLALASGVVVFLLYRTAAPPGSGAGGRGFRAVLTRDIVLAGLAGVLLVSAQMSVLSYVVTYFVHDRRLSFGVAAVFLAAAQLVGALGRIFWGVVSDRYLGGRRRGALHLAALTGAAGGVALALLPGSAPLALAGLAVLVCTVGAVGWNGVQISFLTELSPPGTEGRGVGLALMIQQAGIVAGPVLFGLVIDSTGSFRPAWLLLAGYLLTAMAVMLAIREPAQALRPRAWT